MENHAAHRFLRFMETLEDATVPPSRLIGIIDRWIEFEAIEPRDRRWLNSHCGARTYRLNPISPLEPARTVVDHYLAPPHEPPSDPRTMPMQELESAAVNLFLEYLLEYYRKTDDPKRPQLKRCVCCRRIFRTFQGYPDRVTCSKSCTHRNWQRSRGLRGS